MARYDWTKIFKKKEKERTFLEMYEQELQRELQNKILVKQELNTQFQEAMKEIDKLKEYKTMHVPASSVVMTATQHTAPHISKMDSGPEIFIQHEKENITYWKNMFENYWRDRQLSSIIPLLSNQFWKERIIVSGGIFSNLWWKREDEGDIDLFIFGLSMVDHSTLHDILISVGWEETVVSDQYKTNPNIVRTYKKKSHNANLIVTNSTTPAQIVNDFDFVHCTPYYRFDEGKFCITKKAYNAVINRQLILNHPERTAPRNYNQRVNKWKERGYEFA